MAHGVWIRFALLKGEEVRVQGDFLVTDQDHVSVFGSHRAANTRSGKIRFELSVFEGLILEHRIENGAAALVLKCFEAVANPDPGRPLEQRVALEAGLEIAIEPGSEASDIVTLGDGFSLAYKAVWTD
ncbi:MAG: hypothetical protein MUC63_02040 [Planctomycetes bacterium]|jgi:hypothetical protein|nr:hypothetical protein [Planctomycetota bacterium]